MIEEDEFGLLKVVEKPAPLSPEERLLAGYEEITAFVLKYGREPKVNTRDMGESKLAMRLQAMIRNDDQRTALEEYDDLGLLKEPEPPASLEEALADERSACSMMGWTCSD